MPGPYTTNLKGGDELAFRLWVDANHVRFDPNETYVNNPQLSQKNPTTSVNPADNSLHYTDEFKTPYHPTFSADSKRATQDAPKWIGNDDTGYKLIDNKGNVVHDETIIPGGHADLPISFLGQPIRS